jgi:hypothetical protein
MRKEPDGLPIVGPTSLGVRPDIDVDLNPQQNVLVNRKGMSVAPNWRDINVNRIPKRLRPIVAGARGSNNAFCFRMGSGAFQQGPFANSLTLEPDSTTHGNVAPAVVVSLAVYETDIAATRPHWQEDET